MVAILIVVAVLVVVAIAAGVSSRRRAAERGRVDRERELIAGELSGHKQEQDAPRFQRAQDQAARHGQRAGGAQRHLDELEPWR